jgi:UDP-3-O-[3-hydroxymyristoyl] glucosamine N-acyltransferase
VVISDGVTIGSDCIIKSNTVIGEAGFGFERDEMGVPIRILHLGTVKIGDRVEIGSLNTICRATLGTTVIEDDVKTDDHVHIAHNCRVRRGAMITACVELSGGVDVGSFAWVGPNSSIIQKLVIGDHAFIGIGSNVTKSVPNGVSVAGNPARMLTRLT